MTLLQLLPDIIRYLGSNFLLPKEVCHLGRTCKSLNMMIGKNETVWRGLIMRYLTKKRPPKKLSYDSYKSLMLISDSSMRMSEAIRRGYEIYVQHNLSKTIQQVLYIRESAVNGHHDIYDFLVERGYPTSRMSNSIARSGDFEFLRNFIEKTYSHVNIQRALRGAVKGGPSDEEGYRDNNVTIITWLLSKGAEITDIVTQSALTGGKLGNLLLILNIRDALPIDALRLAVKGSLEVIRYLVEKRGFDPRQDKMLLDHVSIVKHDIIDYLIEEGANIKGLTKLLTNAACHYDHELITYLLDHGASFQDCHQNPIQILLERDPHNGRIRTTIELILERGAIANNIDFTKVHYDNAEFARDIFDRCSGSKRCIGRTVKGGQCSWLGSFVNGRCHQHSM